MRVGLGQWASTMLRRQARERREYIFRKSQEQQQRAAHGKKAALKAAMESGTCITCNCLWRGHSVGSLNPFAHCTMWTHAGKPIPTELRKEALELKRKMHFDDPDTEVLQDSRDDEYRLAGVNDPKVVITTSRVRCHPRVTTTASIPIPLVVVCCHAKFSQLRAQSDICRIPVLG